MDTAAKAPNTTAPSDQGRPPTKEPWLNPQVPVEERVQSWLSAKGYPLEFRAAEALVTTGFSVDQGHHVSGREPGSALEIDVLAETTSDVVSFEMLVECEVIPSPQIWVAFGCSLPGSPIAGTNWSYSAAKLRGERRFNDNHIRIGEAVKESCGVGSSLRVAGRHETTDSGYRAVNLLLAKTLARVAEMPIAMFGVVLPTLVVDGELAIAKWSSGKFAVEPTSHVQLFWRAFGGWPGQYAVVDVVRIEALPGLAARRRNAAQIWINEMQSPEARDARVEALQEHRARLEGHAYPEPKIRTL